MREVGTPLGSLEFSQLHGRKENLSQGAVSPASKLGSFDFQNFSRKRNHVLSVTDFIFMRHVPWAGFRRCLASETLLLSRTLGEGPKAQRG